MGTGTAVGRFGIRGATHLAVIVVAAVLVAGLNAVPAQAARPGAVRLVSHTPSSATTAPNGASSAAIPSAGGQFVAFQSTATNVVPGQVDANGPGSDVFLFELATGTVTLVSHAATSATTTANGASSGPSISADGAYVTFTSTATDLVPGQVDSNASTDVFLFERATGAVRLVSHAALNATTTASGVSGSAVISANGAFVAFQSIGNNLVPGQLDGNGAADVFLFSRATGAVALVSRLPDAAAMTANAASTGPSISADGAWVAFQSAATNLVTGQSDGNGAADVFLYERATGAVTLVSHSSGATTTTANGASTGPSISADGGFVAFQSAGTDLAAGQNDTNGAVDDVFLYERATGAVTLVSHTPAGPGITPNGRSFSPSLSANGRFVVFQSAATNLVTGQVDSNVSNDVFLFDRSTGVVTLASHVPGSPTTAANGFNCCTSISADGAFVAFQSTATNLVTGQTDAGFSTGDVFLFERATGTVTLVSHTPAGPTTTGNQSSFAPAVSADGAFVAFASNATNLVAGQADTNLASDVFLYQRIATGPTYADFDGDRRTDVAVFRPTTAHWFLADGFTQFGTAGDIPVPADYDGDGEAEIAVFRPSSGVWFVSGGPTVAFGTAGDIPVPADYNGDEVAEIAVFRPSSGVWFIHGGPTVVFGTSGDIPVAGDYDGDGDADIAVFRPSRGVWFVHGGPTVPFGTSGDIPVPADYDGDGDTDIAVFRPSSGVWFVSGGPTVHFGTAGDIPVPGNYDEDRAAEIAVFRPAGGYWFIEGGTVAVYGTSGDVPLPLPDAIRRFFFPPL